MNQYIYAFGALFLTMIGVLYVQYKLKLFRNKWFTVGLELLMAFNAFFTIIILYNATENRHIDTLNKNSELYAQITKPVFSNMYDIFDKNEHMNYFFDELFNGIVNPNAKRDEITEQVICYKLFLDLGSYIIFYYNHIDLANFRENTKTQNIRVVNFVKLFFKQDSFKKYLKKYMQDVAGGPKFIRYFKEFFEKEIEGLNILL